MLSKCVARECTRSSVHKCHKTAFPRESRIADARSVEPVLGQRIVGSRRWRVRTPWSAIHAMMEVASSLSRLIFASFTIIVTRRSGAALWHGTARRTTGSSRTSSSATVRRALRGALRVVDDGCSSCVVVGNRLRSNCIERGAHPATVLTDRGIRTLSHAFPAFRPCLIRAPPPRPPTCCWRGAVRHTMTCDDASLHVSRQRGELAGADRARGRTARKLRVRPAAVPVRAQLHMDRRVRRAMGGARASSISKDC